MVYFPTMGAYGAAKTGMMASQLGIQVVNHNISNASTPGYSRQMSEQVSQTPIGGLMLGTGLSQIGQGVTIDAISRAHSRFLDAQYNGNQSALGHDSVLSQTMQQLEAMIGEPGTPGISDGMAQFFEAAAALSRSPESIPIRHNFIQSAKEMLERMQSVALQAKDLRSNLVGDPDQPSTFSASMASLTVDSINTQLAEVANLNKQIVVIESSGSNANDLLDRRDQLLSELSKKLNIEVVYRDNAQVDIKLGSAYLLRSGVVQQTLEAVQNTGVTKYDTPLFIQLQPLGTSINTDITGGELGGILAMGGNTPGQTTLRGMIEKLDTLFTAVATEINVLQASGLRLDGSATAAGVDDDIFVLSAGSDLDLFNYDVNSVFEDHPDYIAAAIAPFAGAGDGRNALSMAQIQTSANAALSQKTPGEFYNDVLSTLGLDSHIASDRYDATSLVNSRIEQQRQSFQGVNVEEEMVELIKYQRAFEASARALRSVDETISTIINLL